ncbi:MAG: hypothetical protein HOP36_09150 [Methyloglobulus sp.]|nr:hypothetical protein [Methyloglobulus sp.]
MDIFHGAIRFSYCGLLIRLGEDLSGDGKCFVEARGHSGKHLPNRPDPRRAGSTGRYFQSTVFISMR